MGLLVLAALTAAATGVAPAPPPATPGLPLGRFVFTYYWIAEEADPEPQVYLYDSTCAVVAASSLKFLRDLAMEGTGRLVDGRLLNFDSRCLCGWEGVPCFHELDEEYPWGSGVEERALIPFRSVAVDPTVVPVGSVLYVRELDGLVMPGAPPWGGWVHDGCVVADDRGGHIFEQHIDFFAGSSAAYHELDGALRARAVTVFEGGSACRP